MFFNEISLHFHLLFILDWLTIYFSGYMCGPTVLDKDGIQAAMHVASMAFEAYRENKLLYDILKETYLK